VSWWFRKPVHRERRIGLNSSSWNEELLPIVQDYLSTTSASSSHGTSKGVEVVEWDDWVQQQEGCDENSALNPGFKLLDFHRGTGKEGAEMAVLDTQSIVEGKSVMKGLGPIKREWILARQCSALST